MPNENDEPDYASIPDQQLEALLIAELSLAVTRIRKLWPEGRSKGFLVAHLRQLAANIEEGTA